MYSASFADDSHLRLLGGHGSGGGGGGRSLGSTQGFGPKTYDPYKLLSPNGNGDWKIHSNDNSSIYWSCVIGNGSAFKIPNLASAKPLNSREQRKIQQLMSSSSLLNTIIKQYQIIANNKNKALVFYSIVDNICWAEINKNNINQYNIYLSKDLFKGKMPFWKFLYLVAHELKHYFDWLDGKLSNNLFGTQVDKNGNSYELLFDELHALQFGNSILSDYYESKKITNRIYMGEYIFYLPDGTEFPFPIMKSMMFNAIKGKY
ncbi:MAG TPA: hypothetical protein PLE30_10920 [Candidatus Kapabacteria bacterium]|nr:hypothetical protein [Candidatus Kapabacteria bacterium]